MLKILKKINILMDKKQKNAMVRLFVMMMISAGLETGAVMMVMAVVQLILDPAALSQGDTYRLICDLLHLRNTVQFSVLAILFLILLYIAKNAFQFFFAEKSVPVCVQQPVQDGIEPDEELCQA